MCNGCSTSASSLHQMLMPRQVQGGNPTLVDKSPPIFQGSMLISWHEGSQIPHSMPGPEPHSIPDSPTPRWVPA